MMRRIGFILFCSAMAGIASAQTASSASFQIHQRTVSAGGSTVDGTNPTDDSATFRSLHFVESAASATLVATANFDGRVGFASQFSGPPAMPSGAGQYLSDASTPIAVGGVTTESSVILSAPVTTVDPLFDQAALQVEFRPVGTAFTNNPNVVGALVNSGLPSSATAPGLVSGLYHWQCRTQDTHGSVSAWSSFGANLETDADVIVDTGAVSGGTFEQTVGITGGSTTAAYRMIGFPVTPTDPDPLANLEDDFGPYDPSQWRLFGWNASSQVYQEATAGSFPIEPHRGYFMISRNSGVAAITGTLANSSVSYDITLQPGWNLIADPFNFNVNWADVLVDGQPLLIQALMGVELWHFDGGAYSLQSELVSGRAYFVRNLTGGSVTLTVPPLLLIKPTWINPAAIGVLYASGGPPPPPPGGTISSIAAGAGRANGPSFAATPGSGRASTGAGSGGGGGGGGGCFALEAAMLSPTSTGLLLAGFLLLGFGLWSIMDRSFRF